MIPVLSKPPLPIHIAPMAASLPVQAVGFEALLSVTTAPVSETTTTPPQVQENAETIVATPEVDIDAEIVPLLAAFNRDAVPQSVSDEISVAESDSIEPVQRESAEIVDPIPVVVPMPITAPIIVTAVIASPMLPSAPQKGHRSVMDRDVESNAATDPAQVPTITIRPPIQAALTPTAPTRAIATDTIAVADFTGLFAAAPIDNNSLPATAFQALMTERTADSAVRPITYDNALIADRALDVATGSLWLDQLAGDIAAVQDEGRDLSFRLIPAQLGQLDVKIATTEDGMQLNFSTQTEEAARLIGCAQSRLVEELKAQGVRVSGSEVNTGSEQSSFAQQNGQSARAATIAEFERPLFQSPEQTHANDPQNGRFA